MKAMQLVFDNADLDFEKYLVQHEQQRHAEKVRPATEFFDLAMDRLENGVKLVGDPMPWEKTLDRFRFRPGETTIWAGVNGNGKSLVMGQTALWLGSKVVIASMEMLPEATLARMLRQACAVSVPTRNYAQSIVEQLKGKIWIYDHIGTIEQESMLGMCHYAAKELGIDHIMIDSLVKCGIGTDDYNGQKRFVDKLTAIAKEHNVHIHLVVHMRKGHRETDVPDKFDVKGAGEITDLADNVLIIARNQSKEEQRRLKRIKGEELSVEDDKTPDAFIRIAKQRHGEYEGLMGFWWHEDSQQWVDRYHGSPMRLGG